MAESSSFPLSALRLNVILEPTTLGEDPSSNIILVHGLCGSAWGTWTHPELGSFWPAWLHNVKGLENSRVMTYGYDADLVKFLGSQSLLDIGDFGNQLLEHLFLHYLHYGDVGLGSTNILIVGSYCVCCA